MSNVDLPCAKYRYLIVDESDEINLLPPNLMIDEADLRISEYSLLYGRLKLWHMNSHKMAMDGVSSI